MRIYAKRAVDRDERTVGNVESTDSRAPALPAAPQLPRRSPLEGMVAQAARACAGADESA